MAKITIYLADELEIKIKQEAKSKHLSQSKWIAQVLSEKLRDIWPSSVSKLAGSWKGTKISESEFRTAGKDTTRERL